jgi:type IV pilus assembly protein PilA
MSIPGSDGQGMGGQFPGGVPPYPPGQYPGGPPGQYPGGMYPPPPPEKKNTWVIVLVGCLVAGFVGIVVIGILAAIAIPNFLMFQSKAKQAEAKTNLSALFTAQIAYFGETNVYGQPSDGKVMSCFDIIQWSPEGMTSYTYYCGDDKIPCTKPGCDPCASSPNLSKLTKDSFVLMAVGNIDRDSTCDVWTIDDQHELKNITSDTSN